MLRDMEHAPLAAGSGQPPGRRRPSGTPDVVLRRERASDCHSVAAAHVAAWRAGYRGLLPADLLDSLDVEQWARVRLSRLGGQPRLTGQVKTLVAEVAARVVGHTTYGMWRADPTVAVDEIWACYVHPDLWGSGVADCLVQAALSELTQTEVRLWVLAANTRAQRFYQRHGFRPDGVGDFFRPAGRAERYPTLRLTLRR